MGYKAQNRYDDLETQRQRALWSELPFRERLMRHLPTVVVFVGVLVIIGCAVLLQ